MRSALDQAELALSAGEVPVGCVIVYQNVIINSSYNKTNETRNGTKYLLLTKVFYSYD